MKPTKSEIAAEVAALKKMKPSVRQTSAFGDDHHKAIDAQIAVLKEGLSEGDVYDRYDPTGDEVVDDCDGRADNIRDEALAACMWRDGTGGDGKPSDSWRELTSA